MYLHYVCEALLIEGHTVTLALDMRTSDAQEKLKKRCPELLEKISFCNAFNTIGRLKGSSKLQAAAQCLEETQADEVFFNNLDDISSRMLRCAAFGVSPPEILRGKISGIYVRPRPLDPSQHGFNNKIKQWGLSRLDKGKWLKNIFLLDEFIIRDANRKHPHTNFCFLPDPWGGDFSLSKEEARQKLGIPQDKIVLLHYGTGGRRKGLHLVLEALSKAHNKKDFFLLCAGKQKNNQALRETIYTLEHENAAKLYDHYIYYEEERLLYCACDFVLAPYLNHFGSSNPISRATGAGRPIIASDYHLIGKRIRTYELGYLFEHNNAASLQKRLDTIANRGAAHLNDFSENLARYAAGCSIDAFRKALLDGLRN